MDVLKKNTRDMKESEDKGSVEVGQFDVDCKTRLRGLLIHEENGMAMIIELGKVQDLDVAME